MVPPPVSSSSPPQPKRTKATYAVSPDTLQAAVPPSAWLPAGSVKEEGAESPDQGIIPPTGPRGASGAAAAAAAGVPEREGQTE